MENIDIFENMSIMLERKRPMYIISYLIVIIITILMILLFGFLYKYNPFKSYLGRVIVNKDNYYISVLIEDNQIPFLNSNLIINNRKQKYKVMRISDNAYIGDNLKKYYEVILKSNIDDKMIINNNIINIKLKLPETTLVKELLKNIKKGLM